MTKPTKPKRGRPTLPRDQVADTWIQLRVTKARKAAYERAAKAQGMNLTYWALRALDGAAEGFAQPEPETAGPSYHAPHVSRLLRKAGMLPVPQTRDGVQVLGSGPGKVNIRCSVCDSQSTEDRLAADVQIILKNNGVSFRRSGNLFWLPA